MPRPRRLVVFVPGSLRALRKLSAYAQRSIMDGIRTHLIENDPKEDTTRKFRLCRPSPHADYELRLASWRIFYRIEEDTAHLSKVKITLIGEKRGNTLVVEGEEVRL
jgi:hypothetical protein